LILHPPPILCLSSSKYISWLHTNSHSCLLVSSLSNSFWCLWEGNWRARIGFVLSRPNGAFSLVTMTNIIATFCPVADDARRRKGTPVFDQAVVTLWEHGSSTNRERSKFYSPRLEFLLARYVQMTRQAICEQEIIVFHLWVSQEVVLHPLSPMFHAEPTLPWIDYFWFDLANTQITTESRTWESGVPCELCEYPRFRISSSQIPNSSTVQIRVRNLDLWSLSTPLCWFFLSHVACNLISMSKFRYPWPLWNPGEVLITVLDDFISVHRFSFVVLRNHPIKQFIFLLTGQRLKGRWRLDIQTLSQLGERCNCLVFENRFSFALDLSTQLLCQFSVFQCVRSFLSTRHTSQNEGGSVTVPCFGGKKI